MSTLFLVPIILIDREQMTRNMIHLYTTHIERGKVVPWKGKEIKNS